MITLKAIEYKDLEDIRQQRNYLYKYFRQYKLLTMADQEAWYRNKYNGDIMFAIQEDNKLIGITGLCYIDMKNRNADLSLYVFKEYINDKCIEVLDLLFKYAFEELGLNRIYNDVFDYDEKKIKLFQDYGFNEEGIAYQRYFRDGKFHNAFLFSFLKEDWEKKCKNIK